MTTMFVHANHCCRFHGCKYGDAECPVILGLLVQGYPCHDCNAEQGHQIQEARFPGVHGWSPPCIHRPQDPPRCGALPRDRKDGNQCFLRAGHPGAIHRSLTGAFLLTRGATLRPELTAPGPSPDEEEPSVTRNEPPVIDPHQRRADRSRQHSAMLLLQDAIEKAHGLGKGDAWDALHLIQAVLNRQEATVKRIQLEYLALVERRIYGTSNANTRKLMEELRKELEK